MKILSKYFKVALCFMAFAFCSFMFAFTPTLTAVQAAATLTTKISEYNLEINALKMPTELVNYENDDAVFAVPLLSSAIGTETPEKYTIKVVDPSGYAHNCDIVYDDETDPLAPKYVIETEDTAFFDKIEDGKLIINAKNDGDYKIIYVVKENGKTYYSNSYHVTVENVSYELDFSTPVLNSDKEIIGSKKNLIPTKMAVSNTAYELPVAYAKIVGKDLTIDETTGLVTNEVATIKVTKDGAPQKLNDTEKTTVFTSNGDKFFITPSEAGVYTVEYAYNDSENRPTKTFTINVEEGFVASELKLASIPTMPKIELGKTVTLPKLTVNAGDEKNVETNVTSIVIEKENSNGAIKCELKDNNLEFKMAPENFTGVDSYAKMVGNYRITYIVKDANGKTLTETFKVEGVKVSSNPTIKLAYDYNSTDKAEDIVFGAEVELKAEYSSELNSIMLPAVYVEDPVSDNFEDFIIVRSIRKGSTYYYVDNYKYDEDAENGKTTDFLAKYKNAALAEGTVGDPTKATEFKFHQDAQNIEGTYYLEYKVISRAVETRESTLYATGTSEKYSFKVLANTSMSKETTANVEITNLQNTSVKNNEEVIVKVNAVDDVDSRLKTSVFVHRGLIDANAITKPESVEKYTDLEYYVKHVADNLSKTIKDNNLSREKNLLDDERLLKGWNEDGTIAADVNTAFFKGLEYYFTDIKPQTETETKNNFKLDLAEFDSGIVNVVAVSINDFGNVGGDTKQLSIKDMTDDKAPVIEIYEEKLPTEWKNGLNIATIKVGQGKEVKLPSVYVEDTDKTLSLNVMYYINSPENSYGAIKYLSPANKKFYYTELSSKEVQVIEGGVITTTEVGTYYVAYSATDVAGNTSVMYFTFEVGDTSKPVLSVEPVADDVSISGNTVTGGKGTVIDFEATLKHSNGADIAENENETITITVDDNGKGLDFAPSGEGRNSYVFNSYGTYIVTIEGSYESSLEVDPIAADKKIIKVVIEKKAIEWLGEFDVPTYAGMKESVKLPDVAASNGAVVKVTYVAPGDSSSEATEAKKVTENGYSYWTFDTNENSVGTYTVTYTATTDEDVLTKTIKIKVGDNVAPTLSFNKGDLTQDFIYDGEHDIEVVLEVNKNKKSFVVKVVNNGEEIISHNIGLTISDKTDDGTTNYNKSWSTGLSYELVGDNVKKGNTSTSSGTTTTQYLISGKGEVSLKLTMTDDYDNTRVETIKLNVIEKTTVEENKDNVVGVVLIVISLVLLAGVILFFTFTGKKGNKGSKTKKEKVVKTQKIENKTESKVEEVKNDVASQDAEEVAVEEAETEEVVEEEAKETPAEEEVIIEESKQNTPAEESVQAKESSSEEPKAEDAENNE